MVRDGLKFKMVFRTLSDGLTNDIQLMPHKTSICLMRTSAVEADRHFEYE